MVNIRAPVVWRIVFVGSWSTASSAGVFSDSKDTLAPESKSAVEFNFFGLVQPELKKYCSLDYF